MTDAPGPNPRVPHFVAGRGSRDDLVLDGSEADTLPGVPVVVEEKLDGANVMPWIDDLGRIEVSLRSGPGAQDRAGQLGPLRAGAAAHDDAPLGALGDWRVMYAEWLLISHSVVYDQLPSYLLVLDLWRDGSGFGTADDRTPAVGRQV